jgi:hypothetical protein
MPKQLAVTVAPHKCDESFAGQLRRRSAEDSLELVPSASTQARLCRRRSIPPDLRDRYNVGRFGIAKCLVLSMVATYLAGCAAETLRSRATTLANAGVSATATLAADQRSTSIQIRSLDELEAFNRTYEACVAKGATCQQRQSPDAASQKREELAEAVDARAKAVEALGEAYKAFQSEAAYNAQADIQQKVGAAFDAVNGYKSILDKIPGVAAYTAAAQPFEKLAAYGAGLLAQRAQDRRLRRDSLWILPVTTELRDNLKREAGVFDSIADYTATIRTRTATNLFDSGLASYDGELQPLLSDVRLSPAANTEDLIAKSERLKTALAASMTARDSARVKQTQAAYRAAVGALDQLISAHSAFERKTPPNLDGLNQRLAELNALLSAKQETGK